jgi:hypothetical protein
MIADVQDGVAANNVHHTEMREQLLRTLLDGDIVDVLIQLAGHASEVCFFEEHVWSRAIPCLCPSAAHNQSCSTFVIP